MFICIKVYISHIKKTPNDVRQLIRVARVYSFQTYHPKIKKV